jgi:hypothetical protein
MITVWYPASCVGPQTEVYNSFEIGHLPVSLLPVSIVPAPSGSFVSADGGGSRGVLDAANSGMSPKARPFSRR